MEAKLNLAGGQREITVEAATPKDLFEEMAMAYEVFNETACGLCGSTNIRPSHRSVDKYHYYEYQCQDCHAKLAMSQSSDQPGRIFPNRKLLLNGKPSLKDGKTGPHQGWTKYRGDNQQDEEPPANVPRHNPPPQRPQQQPLTEADHHAAIATLKKVLHSCGAQNIDEANAILQMALGDTVMELNRHVRSKGIAETGTRLVLELAKKFPKHLNRIGKVWQAGVRGGMEPSNHAHLSDLCKFVTNDLNARLDQVVEDDLWKEFYDSLTAKAFEYDDTLMRNVDLWKKKEVEHLR